MKKISVVIVVKNEEKNISRCLNSVKWADEILVVDTGSTDRTREICRSFPCRLIEREWTGFGPTKKWAVEQAENDWVLSLDADEEVSASLRRKMDDLLQDDQSAAGYRIRRRSYYLGKVIRHSGWDHDFPLRLFNRTYGNFNQKAIHESVTLKGRIEKISEPVIHYPYPEIGTHLQKIDHYA
ncbi:MAG: glycosyltransferase family 2 protein, partial [Calditrichia bacterium]